MESINQSPLLKTILLGVAIALMVGGVWVIYTSPSAVPRQAQELPEQSGEGPVYVVVEPGATAASIGERLEEEDIIDSGASFERLASILGAGDSLVEGEYEFEEGTSVLDAVTRIRDGLTSASLVTLPEGLRIEEVANILEESEVVTADEFLAAAANISGSDIDAELLASRPDSSSLEGYLYPATYSFARTIDAPQVVVALLETMADRFSEELRAAAAANDMTIHQVLTIASIVEREASLLEERPIVASVYFNRIEEGMPLQADPTVQYAVTQQPGSVDAFGYWKSPLSLEDLEYDSPYNTYVHPGLPPGPIANPSIEAIRAVLEPADTDYLFFVATGDGGHAFAETYDEHLANIDRYQ